MKIARHKLRRAERGADMLVKDFLGNIQGVGFHVFDSHQEQMNDVGVGHDDQDFEVYTYNIRKNNKPKEGDVFLYRRPGKSSRNRRFYIYGGGVISKITEPDEKGDVKALVKKAFKLKTPIYQGQERIEKLIWTSKKRKPSTWNHFWSQYGMNVINAHDFYSLVGDLECYRPDSKSTTGADWMEMVEEYEHVKNVDPTGFSIHVDATRVKEQHIILAQSNPTIQGNCFQNRLIAEEEKTLGRAGIELVLELERERALEWGGRVESRADITEGIGGFDIRVTSPEGFKKYIRVKTTRSSNADGFYLTSNELNAYRKKPGMKSDYWIYRVYNYDLKTKTANIKRFHLPMRDDAFRFEAVSWKVFAKEEW